MTFTNPREVIDFIRGCLVYSTPERLYSATIEETPEFWKLRLFDDLTEIDDSETLEKVFLSTESFPYPIGPTQGADRVSRGGTAQNTFKLGGHSQRTRHIHIDLVCQKGCWHINKIWKCR